jgi:glycosyltransferase involved in cell wall biosynthesis
VWPETVLLVHNRYQERGGEDAAYEAEAGLLEARGHRVVRYEVWNRDVGERSRIGLAAGTVWSRDAQRALRAVVRRERPAVAHFHNTLPLISPAAYWTVREEGVAVVQTLHNFRLGCPSGLLLRNGAPCEACVGKAVAWPAVAHGCYRNDRPASAVVATMLTVHRALGTWANKVDMYIALSPFARERFIRAGLPGERVVEKPNFSEDGGAGEHEGDFVLFVGRLSAEKGVQVLLDALGLVGGGVRLVLVGDGPLAGAVEAAVARGDRIEWRRSCPPAEVRMLMRQARALVVPSICYEGCPMVLPEAYSAGLPVLASRHGSLADLVVDGTTGLHFTPGDAGALAAVLAAIRDDARLLAPLGRGARAAYERAYSPGRNYDALVGIYRSARERAAA